MHCARAATGVRYSQIFSNRMNAEYSHAWEIFPQRIYRTLFVGARRNLVTLEVWPIETYFPNFVNFGPDVPWYHAATYISPSVVRKLTLVKWLFDNYPMFAFANRFWATVCRVRPMLSDRSLSCLSVCLSCPILSVCLQRWCIVAKRLDGSRWNLVCR